ncbi:hypothetical protein P186_0167 [Pyrobaculum ferrireducens]|uniref:Uncharacterized protein n=1 Tax=Pyrobaculum ferrireducens TaxID=1104324 RepID=G7VEK4_9CREN|nr:hypothetical protein P186_0167 [Pyrobaculum ferrireducens]
MAFFRWWIGLCCFDCGVCLGEVAPWGVLWRFNFYIVVSVWAR